MKSKVKESLLNDKEYWKLSNNELAKKYNCSRATIVRSLRDLGLKKDKTYSQKNKPYTNRSKSPILIHSELDEIITGSLLGDGYITPFYIDKIKTNKNKNSCFVIKHCEAQKDYVKFKQSLIEKHVKCYYRECKRIDLRFKVPEYTAITLETTQNSSFSYYRELWYKSKKTIPFESLNITPLSLAIWFQDDGSNAKCGYLLCTNGFSTIEVSKLCKILNSKFVLSSYIRMGHNKPMIYIPARDVQTFNNIILPYMCKSMMYKLIVRNKQSELLGSPHGEDNQQPSLSSNTLEGSTTNTRLLPDNAGESNGNTSALPR